MDTKQDQFVYTQIPQEARDLVDDCGHTFRHRDHRDYVLVNAAETQVFGINPHTGELDLALDTDLSTFVTLDTDDLIEEYMTPSFWYPYL